MEIVSTGCIEAETDKHEIKEGVFAGVKDVD